MGRCRASKVLPLKVFENPLLARLSVARADVGRVVFASRRWTAKALQGKEERFKLRYRICIGGCARRSVRRLVRPLSNLFDALWVFSSFCTLLGTLKHFFKISLPIFSLLKSFFGFSCF